MASARILVLSASAGAGHLRAAEAVSLALQERGASVRNVDVLQLATPAFRRLYGQGYLDLVARAPYVLGWLYDLLDQEPSSKHKADRLRLAVERLQLKPFLALLKEEPWDAVVNTHFLPAEIVASLRRKGELGVPQFTVTTDFLTHRLWVNSPTDGYFTATEDGAAILASWGVPAGIIRVTGIPIHPVFSKPKTRAACLAAHGLAADRPVVLQMAGGFGVGPVERLASAVLAVERPLSLVVCCGRNAALAQRLAKLRVPARHRLKVMGFTDKVDELVRAADVVVSKPGGLSTSEILACGAALMIVNPIPGQESQNSDFLLENGAALKVVHPATLTPKLTRLLSDRKLLDRVRANAKSLGRPRAAFAVADSVLEHLASRHGRARRF